MGLNFVSCIRLKTFGGNSCIMKTKLNIQLHLKTFLCLCRKQSFGHSDSRFLIHHLKTHDSDSEVLFCVVLFCVQFTNMQRTSSEPEAHKYAVFWLILSGEARAWWWSSSLPAYSMLVRWTYLHSFCLAIFDVVGNSSSYSQPSWSTTTWAV